MSETAGHLAALACAATWAVATVIFGRATASIDVRLLNLMKVTVSALLLGATVFVVHGLPTITAREGGILVGSALLGIVVADTAYFVVLREIGSARGVLFVSLVPVCTALLASPLLDEALTWKMLVGMALTLVGVSVVVLGSSVNVAGPHGSLVRGVVAGFVYCVAQAGANVMAKSAVATVPPLVTATARMASASFLLAMWLGASLLLRPRERAALPAQWRAVRAMLVPLGVATFLGTYVGMILGTSALVGAKVGVVTTLTATTPLWALFFARVFLGETPTMRSLGGTVLALVGVALLVG